MARTKTFACGCRISVSACDAHREIAVESIGSPIVNEQEEVLAALASLGRRRLSGECVCPSPRCHHWPS